MVASVIINFNQYREDETDSPFPNRKKLVGVRIREGGEPVEIPMEDDADSGEVVTIRITSDHVTVVEYEVIESYLLGNSSFELS